MHMAKEQLKKQLLVNFTNIFPCTKVTNYLFGER